MPFGADVFDRLLDSDDQGGAEEGVDCKFAKMVLFLMWKKLKVESRFAGLELEGR